VEHPAIGGFAQHIWAAAGVREGLLEQQVSLGWGIVALALVALVAWLRRDRQSLALAAVPILAAVGLTALVCSLSPERTVGSVAFVRPSTVIYGMLPIFRSYARFGLVVQLMAVLLAGAGAERLWRNGTARARMACVALLTLAACEYAVWPPSLWRDVLPTQAHRWVMQQPDRVHALDCAPRTAESASVQWLTHYRVSQNESISDCREPNLVDKLSAAGYTHLLARRGTAEGQWLETRGTPNGLHIAARFNNAEVFAVTSPAPRVYTARMMQFYPREFDDTWTWRWMGSNASWIVANRTSRDVVAAADIEMSAFSGTRGVVLFLDDRKMQTVTVHEGRSVERIGPLMLSPGEHELEFRAIAPPTVADDVMKNGDRRALSFALGTWSWTVQEERP
jgi:hypothetical protein